MTRVAERYCTSLQKMRMRAARAARTQKFANHALPPSTVVGARTDAIGEQPWRARLRVGFWSATAVVVAPADPSVDQSGRRRAKHGGVSGASQSVAVSASAR
jgi:hypothetical protein